MKQKIKESLLFFLIFGFIIAISFIGLILPDKDFSENENKYLAKLPSFSITELLNGKFSSKYENYVADQFLLRDEWIAAKSISEFMLLKTENNNVVYGKNGYMFPKFSSFSEQTMTANLNAIDSFAYKTDSNVYMLIVPSSYYPLAAYVPEGLPVVDEGYFITAAHNYLKNNVIAINAKDILCANASEYIYYRTDHHWTTYGAWLAYSQFAKQKGFEPFEYSYEDAIAVEVFLGTSYSKTKQFNVQADTIHYFKQLECQSLTSGGNTYQTLYNTEQFEKRDKYSGFLFGNSSIIEITTEPREDKLDSILIIRDSFADSLVPFLTRHYNKIVLVDPRYYNASFAELGAQNFTDILVLFGFEDLSSEKTIAKLGL